MKIEKYDNQYLEECISLFIQVFNSAPWNDNWEFPICKKYLLEYIDNPNFIGYVIIENNHIIGACFGHLKSWYRGKEFFIDEMFIDMKFQRRGMGTSLLSYIADELKRNRIVSITLLTSIHSFAYNFYKKSGFKEIDHLKFMYKNLDT